ncbi:hypothetical protein MRX96_041892 [Rhipicephalus microplus]
MSGQLFITNVTYFPQNVEMVDAEPFPELSELVECFLRTHRCIGAISINLSGDEKTGISLLRTACQNKSIRSLSLTGIETSARRAISSVLPHLKNVENLNLSLTMGSLDGYVAPLCALLQASSCLKRLHLWGKLANEQAVGTLMTMLLNKPTLEELNISAFSLDSDVYLQRLQEYISLTTALKNLSLTTRNRSLQMTVLEGVLKNRSIAKLSLRMFEGTEESTALASRIIRENHVIRSLSIVSSYQEPRGLHSVYDCWVTPLIQNDVLEEVTLCSSILHPTKWFDYFRSLPMKQRLKMVRILPDSPRSHIQQLCTELKDSEWAKKVDLIPSIKMGDGIETLQCPAIRRGDLSRVHSADLKLPALHQLVNCQHLESFCISIDSDHMRLSLALANYLRSTTTLRGLELDIRCNAQEETHGRKLWWNAILEAISQSKSVNRLDLTMSGLNIQDSQDLATSVKCSTYIRELAIVNTPKANNTAFLRCLSEDIQENYTLASVKLVGGIDAHAVSHWLTVKETTWRNLGFVARAARMIEASDSDRYVTSAVEHIARYPALMDEVAETAKLDLTELGVLVRDRLRGIQSMDGFMRFVGVVKERVVCDPAEDGCMRLDDLNEDCWLHVRRYLVTDDVKYDALQVGSL